jgi:hypothetical protein
MSKRPDSEPPSSQPRLPAAPKLPSKPRKAKAPAEVEKKSGRTWRDYILWGVLVLLAVGALAEFRAQVAYRKVLATCNAALDRNEEGKSDEGRSKNNRNQLAFEELKASLPPDPVHTTGLHSFAQTDIYTWTWQGVRRYKVHLYVDKKNGKAFDVVSEP